jgi:N-acetylglucosaminyldiphosphoundecaprenol N-acetyl-beta-D-mannosaminyltransferase
MPVQRMSNLVPNQARIGDLWLHRVGMGQVLDMFQGWVERREPHHVVTVNLQFLSIASRKRAFVDVVRNAGLAVADGVAILWISKLGRCPIPQHITGHDLIHACAAESAQRGYSIFLFGGAPGVAEQASARLQQLYPGVSIVGTCHGMASEEEDWHLVEVIRQARPDFLFVALGAPKQEFRIHRHLHQICYPVCGGIGGDLDVLAGRARRAPVWMQKSGLEWAYRLGKEPGRLWKRYLLQALPMAIRAGTSALVKSARP